MVSVRSGAGDTGDADAKVRAGKGTHAPRHLKGDLGADHAVGRERLGLHAEDLLLDGLGVGDDAALEHVGGAGHVGQGLGKESAGAGLRQRHGLTAGFQLPDDPFREGR